MQLNGNSSPLFSRKVFFVSEAQRKSQKIRGNGREVMQNASSLCIL